jgi:hypothetical protein
MSTRKFEPWPQFLSKPRQPYHPPVTWNWLVHSNAGLLTRIAAGATIFLVLASLDLKKNGGAARRWREYAFLIACALIAMAYGAINDQVTSAISWEYFYYGKELDKILGPTVPPDRLALSLQAAIVGLKATWSVGLILGVALLIANNPRPARAPLGFSRLFALLPMVLVITVTFAAAFGALGWLGYLNWISADFRDMWDADAFRPRHFMATWGVHLGGYVGGLLGGVVAVARVARLRRRAALTPA